MKKKLLMAFGFLVLTGSLVQARGFKDKQNTPTVEDPANAVEAFSVIVGTISSAKLYTPSQLRDIRRVIIENAGSTAVHITTWSLSSTDWSSSTNAVPASYILPSSGTLNLASNATFYARYESGAVSGTVRGLQMWNNPAFIQDSSGTPGR